MLTDESSCSGPPRHRGGLATYRGLAGPGKPGAPSSCLPARPTATRTSSATPRRFRCSPTAPTRPRRRRSAQLVASHRALNIDRVVLIQPSVYGTDNACLLAAMREIGSHARGIAVGRRQDDQTPTSTRSSGPACAASASTSRRQGNPIRRWRATASSARSSASASRRLHVQMFTRPAVIAAIKDAVAASPVTVVFNHFGGAQVRGRSGAAGIRRAGLARRLGSRPM